MYRFPFFMRFVIVLLVLSLLVGGGQALYRAGWVQGYQVGLLTASTTSPNQGNPAPVPYYGYPMGRFWPGYGFPGFFNPFGPLLGIGFFLLILFLIGGLFRPWGGRHWHGGYGPQPGGPGSQQQPPQSPQGSQPGEGRPAPPPDTDETPPWE